MNYYNTEKIDKHDATYNVIIGERSNGKTYALLKKVLKNYVKTKKHFAYVRRWKEDIIGRRAQRLFSGINENRIIEELTDGEFTGVHYFSGKYYFCTYNKSGKQFTMRTT